MWDTNWNPAKMRAMEVMWSGLRPTVDENVSGPEAERYMLQYQKLSSEWLPHVVGAEYVEHILETRLKGAYNIALLRSDKKTERAREAHAKRDPEYLALEIQLIEAHGNAVYSKLQYESAIRFHHAYKKIYEEANKERFM